MNSFPPSVSGFLRIHGCSASPADGSGREAEQVIRCFQHAYPADVSLSGEGKAYLSALRDCLGAMDERLYHEYRPLADLFRRFVSEAAPSADPGDPVWKEALAYGARTGLADPEELFCRPHKNEAGGCDV